MIQDRHILLISDDQQKASDLHTVLRQYAEVELRNVEKFQQLDIAFGEHLPRLIILLVTASANSHITWLKKIRVAKKLNEIPVFVYNEMPGKDEMQELVKEMQRAD